jgi:hypothetical protein
MTKGTYMHKARTLLSVTQFAMIWLQYFGLYQLSCFYCDLTHFTVPPGNVYFLFKRQWTFTSLKLTAMIILTLNLHPTNKLKPLFYQITHARSRQKFIQEFFS